MNKIIGSSTPHSEAQSWFVACIHGVEKVCARAGAAERMPASTKATTSDLRIE